MKLKTPELRVSPTAVRALKHGAPTVLGVLSPASVRRLRLMCRRLEAHPRLDHGTGKVAATLHGSMVYLPAAAHATFASWASTLGRALGARDINLLGRVRAAPHGTRAQIWHVDDEYQEEASYSLFIYLTDVTKANGATEWRVTRRDGAAVRAARGLWGSGVAKTRSGNVKFARAGTRSLRLPGRAGTVVGFQGAAVHRGRANLTSRARDVLVLVLSK